MAVESRIGANIRRGFRRRVKGTLAGRVRWAFALVILIVVPLLALAVNYMDRLSQHAEFTERSGRLLDRMEELRTRVEVNIQASVEASKGTEPLLAAISQMGWNSQDLDRAISLATSAGRQSASCRASLEVVRSLLPIASLSDIGLSCDSGPWRTALRESLAADRKAAVQVFQERRAELSTLANDATRNLVTMLILILILIAYLLVRFPPRLVLPIKRFSNVLKQAEGGRLDVSAPATGLAEIDELVFSFNNFLVSLREFDSKKRNRIIIDRSKIEFLISELQDPVAIVDMNFALDACNLGFRDLFQLGQDWRGKRITEFAAEGGNAFRQLFQQLARHSEPVSTPIIVEQSSGVQHHGTAEIVPIFGGGGLVGGAIVTVRLSRPTV